MSATFNIELFSNYFSKTSIIDVEKYDNYLGIEDRMRREEEEKSDKEAQIWGPCKPEQWVSRNIGDN